MSFEIGNNPPALPQGSWILVTGANSFIGSHVCNELLQRGYKVRGTVRSISRCQWVLDRFIKDYGAENFELLELPDLGTPGLFDQHFKEVLGVCHVATEATASYDPTQSVQKTIDSTTSILRSALSSNSVQRFVLTSSSAAVYTPSLAAVVPHTITPQDWNIDVIMRAWAPPPYSMDRWNAVYGACKTQSERALWALMREHKTDLVLNTVAPDSTFGQVLHPDPHGATSTAKILREAWEQGSAKPLDLLRVGGYRWYINVKDTARLHVSALLDPQVKGERLLGYAGRYDGDAVLAVFHQIVEEKSLKDKHVEEKTEGDWGCIDTVDAGRSLEVLKRLGSGGWMGFEETIKETLSL